MTTQKKKSTEEPTTETLEEAKQKPESLIYCGPSLPNGLLSRFVVFRGGIPVHLEKHVQACPALKHMFVPVKAFSDMHKALNTVGSAENLLFEEVKQHFFGGGN